MGFYPPASLVRDAQRRGVRVVPPCVNAADATCTITDDGAVRIGLGYVREVRPADAAAGTGRRARRRGSVSGSPTLRPAPRSQRTQFAQLIRAGSCDVFGQPRRGMLWQLHALSRPIRHDAHTQLTLALPAARRPAAG